MLQIRGVKGEGYRHDHILHLYYAFGPFRGVCIAHLPHFLSRDIDNPSLRTVSDYARLVLSF